MLKRGSLTIATAAILFMALGAITTTASADRRVNSGYSFNNLENRGSTDLYKVHKKRKGKYKKHRHKYRKHRQRRSGIRFYYSPFYDPFYDPFYSPYWAYPRHHYYRGRPRSGITFYFGD